MLERSYKLYKLPFSLLAIYKSLVLIDIYYDLHPTQASRGLARVKTERMAGHQQVRDVPKTAC